MNTPTVEDKINPVMPHNVAPVSPEEIISVISDYTGVPVPNIMMQKRFGKRNVTYARHLAMYMIRCKTKLSLKGIADNYFNGCNHTSIINGFKNIKGLSDVYEETRNDINLINSALK